MILLVPNVLPSDEPFHKNQGQKFKRGIHICGLIPREEIGHKKILDEVLHMVLEPVLSLHECERVDP